MKPHAEMERLIARATSAVHPALCHKFVRAQALSDYGEPGVDAIADVEVGTHATMPVARLMRMARGPAAAVYITWDAHGRCRYVGSVRRPGAPAAVRERLREHLRVIERRGRWYAVTVLPIRVELGLEVVRQCEGIVARRVCPAEGAAHPLPSSAGEQLLSDLIAAERPGIRAVRG